MNQNNNANTVLKQFINELYGQHPNILTPERIMHCYGVANFLYCYCNNHDYSHTFCKQMYIVGLLHDIGYLENHVGINHSDKGVDILEQMGLDDEWLYLIENHGHYVENPTSYLTILWLADMCINKNGQFEGYEKRYESILQRYDSNDYRLNDVHKIVAYLRKHYPEYSGKENSI